MLIHECSSLVYEGTRICGLSLLLQVHRCLALAIKGAHRTNYASWGRIITFNVIWFLEWKFCCVEFLCSLLNASVLAEIEIYLDTCYVSDLFWAALCKTCLDGFSNVVRIGIIATVEWLTTSSTKTFTFETVLIPENDPVHVSIHSSISTRKSVIIQPTFKLVPWCSLKNNLCRKFLDPDQSGNKITISLSSEE